MSRCLRALKIFICVFSIFEDLDFAKESGVDDPDIEMLYDCMEMSRDSLMLSNNLLPSCLLGRLGGKKDNPAIGRLLNQAARPHFDCLYSSQGKVISTIRPRQDGQYFADDISNSFLCMKIVVFCLKNYEMCPNSPIRSYPALVQLIGNRQLSANDGPIY